jgi:signal transduction histidine kinase
MFIYQEVLVRWSPREVFEQYKLDIPLKLLKDGLLHTQKVYKGVFEFTNLVKQGNKLEMAECDLREVMTNYLQTTAYKDQVIMDWLPRVRINEALFCTAVDNLIRNGLKYNDSENKVVAIYGVDDRTIAIQDNGRGMTQEEFDVFSRTNTRRENQKEKGSGLGLGICIAILREHGFNVSCEAPAEGGTRIKIAIGSSLDAVKS